MEPNQTIEQLEAAISSAKADGLKFIEVDVLEAMLHDLRKSSHMAIEFQKLSSQHTLAQYDAQNKLNLESYKSVLDAGREALNALLLINGGAVVALLGFMGATISKGLPAELGLRLTTPLACFGAGVLLGACSFGVRYLAQFCFAKEWKIAGTATNVGSIVLAASGYGAFAIGLYSAYGAFIMQFHP